jgi:trehalose 6-phosphate phosphatase
LTAPLESPGRSRSLWEEWDTLVPRLGHSSLLAAFDYDGTLTPIEATPEEAVADESILESIAILARAPRTVVAVVSGRRAADLRQLVPGEVVWLVGLHGLETAAPAGDAVPAIDLDDTASRLAPLREAASTIVARHPGVRLEDKAATLALHTRGAERATAAAALAEFEQTARGTDGVALLAGKEVLEAMPAGHDKGTALRRLWSTLGSEIVLYVGDDTTDESAFRALEGAGAVTVKVGAAGATSATYHVGCQDDVREIVDRLAAMRG